MKNGGYPQVLYQRYCIVIYRIPYTKNTPIYKNDRFLIEHFRIRSPIAIRYL